MEELKEPIKTRVESRIKDELTPVDLESQYREMLDDCYSFDSVGGPFAGMSAARVLEQVDEVAYRCGLGDYEDSRSRDGDLEELDGNYYEAKEVRSIVEEEEAEASKVKP